MTPELAPPASGRWTPQRKADVVRALRARTVSAEEVMAALNISVEELDSWTQRYQRHGPAGLAQHNIRELP